MNDASKQGTEEFKSKWVVPTEESRAELVEWGLLHKENKIRSITLWPKVLNVSIVLG